MTAFEKGNGLEPSLVDAHLILAEVYFRERDYKKAEYFAAVIKESDNLLAYSGLAETKVKKGDIKGAVQFLEEAVSLSPRNVTLRLRLAGLLENEGRDLEGTGGLPSNRHVGFRSPCR